MGVLPGESFHSMLVYRITLPKFANDLSGEGSRIFGSRWNHKGIYCLYAAESRALALLEFSVNTRIHDLPGLLSVITYNIPESIHQLRVTDLPANWDNPIVTDKTRDFGTNLLNESNAVAIQIPSVVIPQEFNFLINPRHPEMKKVTIADISPFSFDVRLKK